MNSLKFTELANKNNCLIASLLKNCNQLQDCSAVRHSPCDYVLAQLESLHMNYYIQLDKLGLKVFLLYKLVPSS